MMHALEWFLFGMFVWGCCIVLQAMQRRLAPDTGEFGASSKHRRGRRRGKRAWAEDFGMGAGESKRENELQEEIGRLKKRIETLEAIVTDRKYQWDDELNS